MKNRVFKAIIALAAVLALLTGCNISSPADTTIPPANIEELEKYGAYKHYFSDLVGDEREAYNNILEKIESFPDRTQVPILNSDQLERVWLALMYDNPELIMLGRECGITVTGSRCWFYCDYALSEEEYEQKRSQLNAKLAQYSAEMAALATDFERELYIHDIIVDNCSYVSSDDLLYSSAYGALVTGEASCEGYAKAAKLLLDIAGIENYLICGTAKRTPTQQEGHMWNVVCLDGLAYNLDLTWDDPVGEEVEENKRYAYFNITDEQILKTHTFDGEPAGCTAQQENYFVKTGRLFDSYDSAMRAALAQIIAENAAAGKADIRFSNEQAYQEAVEGLFVREEVYRALEIAALASASEFSTTQIKYINDDEHLIIELILVEP